MTTLNLILIIAILVLGFCNWTLRKKIKKLEAEKAEVGEDGVGSGIGKWNRDKKEEKEKRKELILGLLEENGRVSNDEVEKLLNVSDSSATRYLEELEQEGKIAQKGSSGRFVHYVPNGPITD